MAYDVPYFLKRNGEELVFNHDGELIFYIPELYFDRENAIIVGEYVNLLGVFDYSLFDKNGKSLTGLKSFKFPTVFLSKPSSIEKMKDVKLKDHSDEKDFRALKFIKGDIVVVSVKVPQTIINVEEFFKLFLTSSIPTTIPYESIQDYFIETMELNGNSYGMTIQMLGIPIGELARDPNDLEKPFRNTKYTNNTNYKFISVKDAPKLVSPYSAITSEVWDDALANSIITNGTKSSPMEKLLMD